MPPEGQLGAFQGELAVRMVLQAGLPGFLWQVGPVGGQVLNASRGRKASL